MQLYFQLIASLAAAASAMPTADPQFMYYVPANSYVQPQGINSIENQLAWYSFLSLLLLVPSVYMSQLKPKMLSELKLSIETSPRRSTSPRWPMSSSPRPWPSPRLRRS